MNKRNQMANQAKMREVLYISKYGLAFFRNLNLESQFCLRSGHWKISSED